MQQGLQDPLARRGSHDLLQVTSFEPDKKKRGRQEPFYEVLAHRLAELEVSLGQTTLNLHLQNLISLMKEPPFLILKTAQTAV